MSRKIIVAGNWKMNKNAAEGKSLVEALKNELSGIDFNEVEVVVCPPFTTISSVIEAASGSAVGVGAQNIHWAPNGAFTGEISADMLVSTGVKYVIIGHSERRQYFGETDATVNSRLKAAIAAGLTPIVCVGETLAERESNRTEEVLARQITEGFAGISAADGAKIVVAYEPVWAIGTGKTATPDIAQAAHSFIRSQLAGVFGTEAAEAIRIQYGGSMKPENARELLSQPDIDGGLIGGAALKADSFAKLIREAVAGSKN
ncbi:MAG: triose-phosphate isomerase [Victivallaceae bacterium]|nr:triose-phosphate isomerase [Victivallaceae bacterium]